MTSNDSKWLRRKGLKLGYLNIRYLQGKMDEIPYILSKANNNFHMFCLSETHLKQDVIYPDLEIPGYQKINEPPSKHLDTGLLLYYSNNLSIKRLENFENLGIECIWTEIYLKKTKPFRIGFVYRNPSENASWFTRFNSMMEAVSYAGAEITLFGDFNLNLRQGQPTWKKIL